MKIKNKILISGISTLSVLGATVFAVNNLNPSGMQNNETNITNQKRNVDKAVWTELKTLEEIEALLPNITTTGAPLQAWNNNFISSSPYAYGEVMYDVHSSYEDSFNGTDPGWGNKFLVKDSLKGNLTLKYKVTDPTVGYLSPYFNTIPLFDSDYYESSDVKFFYDGSEYISIAVSFPDDPNWYDLKAADEIVLHPHIIPHPDVPTDADLARWNFKVKTGVKSTATYTESSYQTVKFDMIEPMWPLPELQPNSFDIYVGESTTPVKNVSIENPGQSRSIEIKSDLIDSSIEQDIRISFNNNDPLIDNYVHDDIIFKTSPSKMVDGLLSVDTYSSTHMKLKIDGFTNGVGWAEADRFEISINDAVKDFDKHNISEFTTGKFEKDLATTGHPVGTTLNIKIMYYKGNVAVAHSNDVDIIVPEDNNPGEFILRNSPITYGKVNVTVFGQELLPNSTHIRATATRIDDPTEVDTVVTIPVPDDNIHNVELLLSHPARYRIDVKYLNMIDPDNPVVTGQSVAYDGDEIDTLTGSTETVLKDGTSLTNVSEKEFSLSGKFDIGTDDTGDDLTGETFELFLNDEILDTNLLSEDNSNIVDPSSPKGTFDKTYSDLTLSHFGVTPGVETDLKIMLNGVQAWTAKITFTAKQFEITSIEAKDIDYTTTTIEWAMTQGSGIEEATKYTIQLLDDDPTIIDPVFEETVDLATTPATYYDIDGLTSARDYTFKMQFMNLDDTPLLDVPAEVSFTTKQYLFEMTDLVVHDKTQTSAKIVFEGFKQGTGDEIATQYTLKVTEAAGLTPPIDLLVTDLTNEYYELTGLAAGGIYTVEIQFMNSFDAPLLGLFTEVIEMGIDNFKVDAIIANEIDYNSAKINFYGLTQGTGSQIATNYDLKLHIGEDITPTPTIKTGIIGPGEDEFHILTELESGVTYNVEVIFKNAAGVELITKKIFEPFTTEQEVFELDGITATVTSDLSASVSFNGFKQGTGNQEATEYEISWLNSGTEVGSDTVSVPSGATNIDPYSITTDLVQGQTYTVKVQFKSGTTNLGTEHETDFTLIQEEDKIFEFTGIDATNIGENSADILLQGIQQGTGEQEATSGVITITGAKVLPEEGEPTTETWDLPINISNGIPSSQSLDGLILASEYTVSVEFKNSTGTLLGVSHTKTFNTTTTYTAKDTSISNFNTVFDSKTNTINFTWNFVRGIDKYGREDAIPDIKMTLNFPDQQVKKEYIFSELASTGSFTIDLNKMIEEKQITQTDIDNGFTVESESGIIKFENSKFTWTLDNTFWTIMVISLLTAGAYLLVKLISKKRKIIL